MSVTRDTIAVYHLLRWRLFLTDPKWQSVMFDALRWYCAAFSAHECVLVYDEHPAAIGIRKGMTFQQALESAERTGYGEVDSFNELYLEMESESDVALGPLEGGLSRCVHWPRGKPLPPGWSRSTVWDSKGYWKFTW